MSGTEKPEPTDVAPAALPPGPRLPLAVQTFLLYRHSPTFLGACHRRYGDCFRIRAAPWGTLVYVADPQVIKQVFTGDTTTFHAGEGNAILGPVLGARSLLLLDEQEHLQQRRLMLPPFHGEAVRRYGDIITAIVEEDLAQWPLGRPFALHPRMRSVTFAVILRAVIGVEDEGRLDQFRRLLPPLVDIGPVTMLLGLWPRLERLGPWRRYATRRAQADELLFDEIRRRRDEPGLTERTDVLSLLVQARDEDGNGLSDAELRDQTVTLLLAGHETTATALAWAFERLVRQPDALARAHRAAVDGDGDYLDAIIKETLRVRPIIFDVIRRLTRLLAVAGYRLPAGAHVMPAIGLVQRSSAHWRDPERFQPERFIDAQPEPYTWIPFGGGPRRCLGAAFAQLEMRTVLETVLRMVELRPTNRSAEKVRARHITLAPAKGARVVAQHRAERLRGTAAEIAVASAEIGARG